MEVCEDRSIWDYTEADVGQTDRPAALNFSVIRKRLRRGRRREKWEKNLPKQRVLLGESH